MERQEASIMEIERSLGMEAMAADTLDLIDELMGSPDEKEANRMLYELKETWEPEDEQ